MPPPARAQEWMLVSGGRQAQRHHVRGPWWCSGCPLLPSPCRPGDGGEGNLRTPWEPGRTTDTAWEMPEGRAGSPAAWRQPRKTGQRCPGVRTRAYCTLMPWVEQAEGQELDVGRAAQGAEELARCPLQ